MPTIVKKITIDWEESSLSLGSRLDSPSNVNAVMQGAPGVFLREGREASHRVEDHTTFTNYSWFLTISPKNMVPTGEQYKRMKKVINWLYPRGS